jgi:hypothetical protein
MPFYSHQQLVSAYRYGHFISTYREFIRVIKNYCKNLRLFDTTICQRF